MKSRESQALHSSVKKLINPPLPFLVIFQLRKLINWILLMSSYHCMYLLFRNELESDKWNLYLCRICRLNRHFSSSADKILSNKKEKKSVEFINVSSNFIRNVDLNWYQNFTIFEEFLCNCKWMYKEMC